MLLQSWKITWTSSVGSCSNLDNVGSRFVFFLLLKEEMLFTAWNLTDRLSWRRKETILDAPILTSSGVESWLGWSAQLSMACHGSWATRLDYQTCDHACGDHGSWWEWGPCWMEYPARAYQEWMERSNRTINSKLASVSKDRCLWWRVIIVNVLSDLGVKRSAPKLNYYLVLEFFNHWTGGGCTVMRWKCVPTYWKVEYWKGVLLMRRQACSELKVSEWFEQVFLQKVKNGVGCQNM